MEFIIGAHDKTLDAVGRVPVETMCRATLLGRRRSAAWRRVLAALVATALVAAAPFAADAQSLQCPETPFLRDGFEPAPTTPQPGTFDQRAGLDLINCARAQVVPPAIPPLAPVVWSNTIAADVQTRANSCSTQFDLSNGYGQVVVSGTLGANPIREAVDILIALRTQYDYANNACSNGLICRNYTQLVLRSATQAACAFAPCGGGLVWCFFDQIQNINVRPY